MESYYKALFTHPCEVKIDARSGLAGLVFRLSFVVWNLGIWDHRGTNNNLLRGTCVP